MKKTQVNIETGEITPSPDNSQDYWQPNPPLPWYVKPRQPGMYDPRAACEECCITDFGPSLTQQNQAEEADINTIVKRFGLTGQLPTNVRTPTYGDFTHVTDYQSALNAVRAAEDAFMKMPAAIRTRFDNDPEKFVEYCSDEQNLDQLREWGLAVPKAKEAANGPTGDVPPSGAPGAAPKP